MHTRQGFLDQRFATRKQLADVVASIIVDHNLLDGLQGGIANEYYHLSAGQHTDLTDGNDSSLHFHSTDRNRANHTGTQLSGTISDFNEAAQDAVGAILLDSSTIDFTYNDAGAVITASVIQAGLDHGSISGLTDDDHLQYHTDSRALTWLGTRSTTDLPEGSNLYHTSERVDDRVALLIQNGTGITWSYNDALNTLTPTVTITQYTDELAQDAVGTIVTDSATIDFTYADATPSITASVIAVPVNDAAADTTTFVGLFGSATGNLIPLTDAGLTYNASTNNLTTTTFTGALSGNATTATLAATSTIADAAGDTTTFPLLAGSATGSLPLLTDSGGLSYNATTKALTTTTFIGALTGNATTATSAATLTTPRTIGNVSFNGSANIVPETIAVIDSTDATSFIAMFDSATGSLQPKTDAGLTYAATTGMLTATGFTGPLTGNVTGNVTGTVSSLANHDTADLAEGSNLYYTDERVDDRVAALLVEGTGITLTYDDVGGTLTIDASGSSYTDEQAQDAVGTIVTDTATIDFTYTDATPSITASVIAVPVVDAAADTTTFVGLFGSATGNLAPLTDAGLTYNASTNALTTTTFIGALTGNATTATTLATPRTIGNVSFNGSADIVPQTIQVADAGADATTFVGLFGSATGNLQPVTNSGLTYNAITEQLTITSNGAGLMNVVGVTSANYNLDDGTDTAWLRLISGNLSLGEGGVDQLSINTSTGNVSINHALSVDETLNVIGNVDFDANLNVDGDITVSAGLETAPSIQVGAQETGLYADTDAFGITINGLNVATFQSTTANGGITTWARAAGDDAFVQAYNDNDAANSNARLYATVQGASGGDATANFRILGGQNWTIGLDNDVSDWFRIAASSELGTSDVLTLTTAGTLFAHGVVIAESDLRVINNVVTGSPRTTLSGGTLTLALGSDSSADTLTDATNKATRIGMPHYTNAEQVMAMMFGNISNVSALLALGGGTSVMNAITRGVLYAADDTTTLTGTIVADWTNTGNVKVKTGGNTTLAPVPVTANVNVTAVGNVTSGEDNLITYALPADAMNAASRGVRITAWGTTVSAGTKTLKVYFGTQLMLTHSIASGVTNVWRVVAEVIRTGTNAQKYVAQVVRLTSGAASIVDVEQGTATQTETAAITIKCTGEDSAAGTNAIVQQGMITELFN